MHSITRCTQLICKQDIVVRVTVIVLSFKVDGDVSLYVIKVSITAKKLTLVRLFLFQPFSCQWSVVAQLVECRTRNRESPGSNPRCYRFEVWAFSFTSRRLSRLSCINEYLAIYSGGNVSE